MKKRTKSVLLALALCAAFSLGAMAANNETITALLNREIKITYNGAEQTFKDAAGNAVYPISYNGTTYLPVRAVSGLVGLPVDWDQATNTVILGSSEKQPTNLVSRPNSGPNGYSWIINDKEELKVPGDSAIQEYSTGIVWNQWNGSASSGKNYVLYFDVAGYNEITFSVWADVNATVKLVDQDYNVITSFKLEKGTITSKTIQLNGVTKLAFASDGAAGNSGIVKILDPVIK